MGTKANPTVIGAFIVGALALIVAAIFVFGSGGLFAEKNTFVLYFGGSVNGLNVGAPVKFRGVEVGTVKNVRALYNTQDYTAYIEVLIEVKPKRLNEVTDGTISPASSSTPDEIDDLIEHGLRGQWQMQSFVTGLLFIALDFYPRTPARLVSLSTEHQEIPTVPTVLEEAVDTIRRAMDALGKFPVDQLLNGILLMLQRINDILTNPEIDQVLASLGSILQEADQAFAGMLTDVPQFVEKLNDTADTATATLETAQVTLLAVQRLVQHVDRQVDPFIGSTQDTLAETRGALRQVRQTLGRLEGAASPTLKQAERAFAAAADLAGSDSLVVNDLAQTLESLEGAARAIRLLAEYLQRNPEALLRGKSRTEGR